MRVEILEWEGHEADLAGKTGLIYFNDREKGEVWVSDVEGFRKEAVFIMPITRVRGVE